MKKENKKIIALCSSASFFKDVLDLERKLKADGFSVKIPYTAGKMRASGDYRVETLKHGSKIQITTGAKHGLLKIISEKFRIAMQYSW